MERRIYRSEDYTGHRNLRRSSHGYGICPGLVSLPGIKIKDISVVDKSYPNYWKDLCKAGFSLEKDEKKEHDYDYTHFSHHTF